MINSLEWESEGKNYVGSYQVDEKDICDCVELFKLVHDTQNYSIADQADDEDDVVQGRKILFGEII